MSPPDGKGPKTRWQLAGRVTSLAVDARGQYLLAGNGNGTVSVLRLRRR